MSSGGPLVVHASKLYTFKVFEMFCKVKTESEDYFVTDCGGDGKFVVEHYNLSIVEYWCKGKYIVQVDSARSTFDCECGMFEHFGLPCCHALRVRDYILQRVVLYLGFTNSPELVIVHLLWCR